MPEEAFTSPVPLRNSKNLEVSPTIQLKLLSLSSISTRHPAQIIKLELELSSSSSNYWPGVCFQLVIQLKLLSWSLSYPPPAQIIELELDFNSSSSSNYWAGVGVILIQLKLLSWSWSATNNNQQHARQEPTNQLSTKTTNKIDKLDEGNLRT